MRGIRVIIKVAVGVLLLFGGAVQAQTLPLPPGANAIRDTVDLSAARPFELQPFIQPGTAKVFLNGTRLDSARYRLNERRGQLRVAQTLQPTLDTLVVVYRTLPFTLKDVYRRNVARSRADTSGADSTTVVQSEADEAETAFDPFGGLKLQHSGSISRGVLAGNRRDATIESGLRMQLSGEVTEGVDVEAVLTDENTPIQPEGTTQRLSDFDRVFIQLKHRRGTARLGDFDLNLDGGTFARFTRKLQGATVRASASRYEPAFFEGGNLEVAGAVSRGEFHTQEIEPIDGVQGPYRLTGKQGERFIIVVAGSEKVYLDGERLERGKTNDYVIDYATGEITFTSEVLVTEDKRFAVEFQYRANRFTRTLVGSEAEFDVGRVADGVARGHFAGTFLRESDDRSLDDAVGLSAEDSLKIAAAGDSAAFRSGAQRVAYDAEAPFVQYVRQPNSGGVDDSIFVPLTRRPRENETVYRVRFSRAGSGEGSYARVGRASGGVAFNGIAYEYRGPGQGDYVPRRPLPTPQRKQVADLRGRFALLKGVEAFGEWAGSVNDRNRLSGRGDADNQGGAYKAGVRVKPIALNGEGWSLGTLGGSLQRRRTGRHFAAFDRIRPVEFERKWNLGLRGQANATQPLGSAGEVIDEGTLRWQPLASSTVRAEYGQLRRGDVFTGTRRALYAESEETGWPALDYRLEYLTSSDSLRGPLTDGQWLRQRGKLRYTFEGFTPRLEVEQERRRQRLARADSLTDGSLAFVELRPGLSYQTEDVQAGGQVAFRTEDRSIGGDLRDAARAWTASANASYQPAPLFNTEARLGYRKKQYTDALRIQQKRRNAESLLLEWDGRYRPLRRSVQLNWRYQGRTERTPTLQEIYVKAGPERGQYVWDDANGDGVIQLDEFLPERTPNEGTYVQTYVPSDSLTSVVNVEAQAQLRWEPARYWRDGADDARWQRWLRQIETRTTVEIAEKSRDPRLFQIYALNLRRFRDAENTLSGRLRLGQDVTLFEEKQRYGLDFSWNQVRGLSELAAGQEKRFANNWSAEGRVRLAPEWTARLKGGWAQRRTVSEAFASRTFDITSMSLEPETSFRPLEAVRMTAGAAWSRKRDAAAGQQARLLKVPVEARLASVRRLQVRAQVEPAFVRLSGAEEAVGLTQYELTDGRGPGASVRWHLGGQYRINEYLRASLSYDGRAPAQAPTVHTVRMNLNATF